MTNARFLLTVVGRDRSGIIADVTHVLYRHGCNLEDVSMTILEGEFTMILVGYLATQPRKHLIDRDLHALHKKLKLTFFWKEYEGGQRRGSRKHLRDANLFLIRAIGKDRTGIVYKISRLLADFGLNITDLNSRLLSKGRNSIYAMILEVDIPKKFSTVKLERALNRLSRSLKIEIMVKPVERIEI